MMNKKNTTKEVAVSITNTSDDMKMATFHELQEALKIKRINDELLEYLTSSLRYLIHYSKKYNIILPENDKINDILDRVMSIADKLP